MIQLQLIIIAVGCDYVMKKWMFISTSDVQDFPKDYGVIVRFSETAFYSYAEKIIKLKQKIS